MDKKPIGIILWQGKSLLDGQRIMVVATGVYSKSQNGKTGDMIQTYILRRDVHPMTARRMGDDYSICGNCKLRETSACYVNLCHGPIAVFYAFLDGSYKHYETADLELFKNRYVRIGSYGDPASVPIEVWENICNVAKGWTGYSHQWKNCDQELKKYCMASVDSIVGFTKEYDKAQSMGWRTFRVRESLDNTLTDKEFVCPASKEGGQKTTCEKCGSCCGTFRENAKNPVIMLHADSAALNNWKYDRYISIMKKIKNKKAWRRDYVSERKIYKATCKF